MIDIRTLRDDPEGLKGKVAEKGFDPALVDQALVLDEKRRELIAEVESLRAERNKAAKERAIEAGKNLKARLQELEPDLEKIEAEFAEVFNRIPNPALPGVPVGKNEGENVEVRRWGQPREFDFEPQDHLELGAQLGILDFETGAKVVGSQFYYLYGDGALLELALVMFAMELLGKEGFTPAITPEGIKSSSLRLH